MKDKILYIDDEQENLDSFQIAFYLKYEIFTAISTSKAEEILEKEAIKVVICDQKMDDETGLEFIDRIKPKYPEVVFTLLTGYVELPLVLESLNSGNIYRFMAKPMEKEEIVQTIKNAVEKYDLEQNRRQLEEKVYQSMIIAEEKERERYAKELHDGLGPILTTCTIYLNTILEENDSILREEYINKTNSLIKEALQSIREISNNLSPDILRKYGLTHAIRSFIERLHLVTKVKFVIDSNIKERFQEIQEFTIYRTLVELINNSVKYAEASKIKIKLNQTKKNLNISFSDNGKGFEYDKVSELGKGFGLTNLETRIQKLGGEYHFKTAPGKGIKVKMQIQVEQND